MAVAHRLNVVFGMNSVLAGDDDYKRRRQQQRQRLCWQSNITRKVCAFCFRCVCACTNLQAKKRCRTLHYCTPMCFFRLHIVRHATLKPNFDETKNCVSLRLHFLFTQHKNCILKIVDSKFLTLLMLK